MILQESSQNFTIKQNSDNDQIQFLLDKPLKSIMAPTSTPSYFSFLIIPLLCLFFPFCISTDTLTPDKPITDNNFIVSRKGNFALGFFTPGNSSYRYLGIWYHNIPGKTVVWVANRENPINGSSGFFSLNPDGNLVLYNDNQQQLPLWTTNVSVKGTKGFVAQLLDSGNLALIQNGSKSIVWQSFDYPTDTVLPGLKLGLDRKRGLDRFLTSWRSPDDPGHGDWSFRLDPTGCPQFKLLYKGSTTYWRSSPWPWAPIVPGDIASFGITAPFNGRNCDRSPSIYTDIVVHTVY